MTDRTPELPYIRVAGELRGLVDGLQPGQRLPAIAELSERYSVSRATVARALRVLADESLVTIVAGWGTFKT